MVKDRIGGVLDMAAWAGWSHGKEMILRVVGSSKPELVNSKQCGGFSTAPDSTGTQFAFSMSLSRLVLMSVHISWHR